MEATTEKARLAFVMMDRDNDGALSRSDFDAALAESLDANGLVVPPETTAATIDALFSGNGGGDGGGDGADSSISFEQFRALLAETPHIDVSALGFTKLGWLPQQVKAKPTALLSTAAAAPRCPRNRSSSRGSSRHGAATEGSAWRTCRMIGATREEGYRRLRWHWRRRRRQRMRHYRHHTLLEAVAFRSIVKGMTRPTPLWQRRHQSTNCLGTAADSQKSTR